MTKRSIGEMRAEHEAKLDALSARLTLTEHKIALGGNTDSLLLEEYGEGMFKAEDGSWWVLLTKPASAYKGGYGECERCHKPVTRGGFDKFENVDGSFCDVKTLLCGKAPCVVLS